MTSGDAGDAGDAGFTLSLQHARVRGVYGMSVTCVTDMSFRQKSLITGTINYGW